MKKILISAINFYQIFLYTSLKNIFGINPSCRYEVTCSHYAKQSIQNYGSIKGTRMSVTRIVKCQPFYKGK